MIGTAVGVCLLLDLIPETLGIDRSRVGMTGDSPGGSAFSSP